MKAIYGHWFDRIRPKGYWRFAAWLAGVAACWLGLAGGPGSHAQAIDAQTQARVTELVQSALGPSWADFELNHDSTNRALARLAAMEASFREASRLWPERLDLRFGLASSLVVQALQTNAPFALRMSDALHVYREIQALDTNGFEAPLLTAAYTRAIGDAATYDTAVLHLMTVHPERTLRYLERFQRLDEILQDPPDPAPPRPRPSNHCHAIVVLGAALETNGAIKPKLLGRLERAWEATRMYPGALVLVTGGNPRNGMTEAYAMSQWFQDRGVARDQLLLEDQARDTVGNAFLSCRLLQRFGVTHVTLVTSANHIQRSLADFEEAARQSGWVFSFDTLASTGEPDLDGLRQRVALYRDVLRASGFWAFPGIQR